MLVVLLTVLKILLYVLLAVLGLALLIVLLILFVPVRYSFIGKKYEGVDALVKVTYLLHLVRAIATYDGDKMLVKVKVLFFTVYTMEQDLGGKKDEEPPEDEGLDLDVQEMDVDEFIDLWNDEKAKEKAKMSASEDKLDVKTLEDELLPKEVLVKEETPLEDKKSISESVKIDRKAEKAAKKEAKKRAKARKKADKDDSKLKVYFTKAKEMYAFLKKDENEGILRFILGKFYKILKSILPKKISGDVRFGLKEPDMMGLAVGGFSLFYPYFRKNLSLTPDFTRDIIEGTLKFRGRVLVVELLYFAIALVADKRVRRLIAQVRTN